MTGLDVPQYRIILEGAPTADWTPDTACAGSAAATGADFLGCGVALVISPSARLVVCCPLSSVWKPGWVFAICYVAKGLFWSWRALCVFPICLYAFFIGVCCVLLPSRCLSVNTPAFSSCTCLSCRSIFWALSTARKQDLLYYCQFIFCLARPTLQRGEQSSKGNLSHSCSCYKRLTTPDLGRA